MTTNRPARQDDARQELLTVLAAIGPHLLDVSRATRSASPEDGFAALREVARVLEPYRTGK